MGYVERKTHKHDPKTKKTPTMYSEGSWSVENIEGKCFFNHQSGAMIGISVTVKISESDYLRAYNREIGYKELMKIYKKEISDFMKSPKPI